MERTTEKDSNYNKLEQMSISEILTNINREDHTVPNVVQKALPQVEGLIKEIVEKMRCGGRLFYFGAGTSGRMGVLDASECPPTYGVPFDMVMGIIAGGDTAIRKAIEFAEDNSEQAWKDLSNYNIVRNDVIVGISASGTTPYVIGGLKEANNNGNLTGCIVCNAESPIAAEAKYPIEIVTGPEFVTGSTRMKAGSAQKMVLNMISTSVMVQLGKVRGNKMIDMQLTNHKLEQRGKQIIMQETNADAETASRLLHQYGNVRKAIENYKSAHYLKI